MDEEELVGEKIDRLNSVINNLITNIDENREFNLRGSWVSEVHQSFYDCSVVNETEGNEELYIPQSILDKFQESLTEIDRLGMVVEDLIGQKSRNECFFNIFLNSEQTVQIYEQLDQALKTSEKSVNLKIQNGRIQGVENCNLIEQLSAVQIENSRLKEQLKILNKEFRDLQMKTDKKKLASTHLELEKKSLALIGKEQELDKLKEDYGTMLVKAEILVHEYINRLEKKEISGHQKKNNKVLSQDFTRTRTPLSVSYPLSSSFLLSGFISYKQEIEKKIQEFEKIVKKKYKKKKKEPIKIPEIFEEFRQREENFNQVLGRQASLQEREKIIMQYLGESREFVLQKVDELRKYQNFLMENWIKANGEPTGIDSVKEVLAGFLMRFKKGVKEREVLDSRIFRCSKIEDNVRKEVRKLQGHREKILEERKKLQIQLLDIEKYLRFIANLNRISNYLFLVCKL